MQSLAEIECRQNALLSKSIFNQDQESDVARMSVENYWKIVLNQGEKRFPDLASCIQVLFSQPFSNASSERAFSVIGSIKTDIRNRLCNVTIASLMRIIN